MLTLIDNHLCPLLVSHRWILHRRSKIHLLNDSLYHQLRVVKSRKFARLSNNTSNSVAHDIVECNIERNIECNNVVNNVVNNTLNVSYNDNHVVNNLANTYEVSPDGNYTANPSLDLSGHTFHQDRQSVFTIPDDLTLSEAEVSVLSKGLNFIPISRKTDVFQIYKDSESFFRRTRLKAFFDDNSTAGNSERDFFQHLNPRKSNWIPPEGQFASLDLFINKCRHDLSNTNFNRNLSYSNLSSIASALAVILPSSLPIKVVLSSYGALISTRKKLYGNFLTLISI